MTTLEVQVVDGVLCLTQRSESETSTYQFLDGEMLEITVDKVIEFRINGAD